MANKNTEEGKKNIDLQITEEKQTNGKKEIDGKLIINYTGRFDSISINSQIEDSSDIFTYTEIDEKKINHPYARLSIFKKDIQNPNIIRFKDIFKKVKVIEPITHEDLIDYLKKCLFVILLPHYYADKVLRFY